MVSDYSDTVSVDRFVEATFGVSTMASLPDEAEVAPYGPRDYANNAISDLTGAFDLAKLVGSAPPNPATLAEIPALEVDTFPAPVTADRFISSRLPFRRNRPTTTR